MKDRFTGVIYVDIVYTVSVGLTSLKKNAVESRNDDIRDNISTLDSNVNVG